MDWLEAVILALIQGITEFLPISSSAHLLLPTTLFGWADQGLAFDVAVHVGSLVAVMTYFRTEILEMTKAWFSSLPVLFTSKGSSSLIEQRLPAEAKLAWAVLLGTIPVGLAGLLLKSFIENNFRSAFVIAMSTIAFGLLLWVADRKASHKRDEYSLRLKDILIIGAAQAIALIPGTSRSGITITAGLMLGLSRAASARFSFLLSIPVIVIAGGFLLFELIEQAEPVDWSMIALGTGISTLSAYACIHLFLTLIDRIGFTPFVIYRLALGAALLFVVGL
jgi:undecaprenyl-diphosphatase